MSEKEDKSNQRVPTRDSDRGNQRKDDQSGRIVEKRDQQGVVISDTYQPPDPKKPPSPPAG